jgi:hypothetical protein
LHKNKIAMRVVRINTTAYQEEDFYLLTTLDDSQIAEVVKPIVNEDNETIWKALTERFPMEHIDMYHEFDQLNF